MLKVKEDGLNIIFMLIQNFKELVFENHLANQNGLPIIGTLRDRHFYRNNF